MMNASRLSAILVPPRTTMRNLFLRDHFDFRLPFRLFPLVSNFSSANFLDSGGIGGYGFFFSFISRDFVCLEIRAAISKRSKFDPVPKTSRKLDPNINFIARIEFIRVKNNVNGRVEPRDRFYKSTGWEIYTPL